MIPQAIMLASAAIALLEQLLPVISNAVKSGQVSAEEQSLLLSHYQRLKNSGDAAFTGPEWDVSPPDAPGAVAPPGGWPPIQ
jgi:hypothetical protein